MFCGIPEIGGTETCEDIVKNILQKLGIACDNRTFQYVYRVGRFFDKSKPRPIMARFQHLKDRNDTWTKRKGLKDPLYIRPMYPPSTYRKRRVLQAVHSLARSVPRVKGKSKLLYSHKLQVDLRGVWYRRPG